MQDELLQLTRCYCPLENLIGPSIDRNSYQSLWNSGLGGINGTRQYPEVSIYMYRATHMDIYYCIIYNIYFSHRTIMVTLFFRYVPEKYSGDKDKGFLLFYTGAHYEPVVRRQH